MLSTGFMGSAYKSFTQTLMPYPCLLAGVLVIVDLAITPLQLTMVQTHLCFRYAWTLAR
jgi:hypothetical protein